MDDLAAFIDGFGGDPAALRSLDCDGPGMADARQALFEALDVTSVINGVELRQTKVLPAARRVSEAEGKQSGTSER